MKLEHGSEAHVAVEPDDSGVRGFGRFTRKTGTLWWGPCEPAAVRTSFAAVHE